MTATLDFYASQMRRDLGKLRTVERIGRVVQVTGLVIESDGPDVGLGDVCEIRSTRTGTSIRAQVVGFRNHRNLLMPLEGMEKIHADCEVVASAHASAVPVGPSLIGRVLDGLGRPIDGRGPLLAETTRPLECAPPHPLTRRRILEPFETSVKAIDAFTPVGCGQRIGLFAGSGVGKSTMLGMMARGAEADVNVIALVGERGRELREFIEKDLGEEGMKRSIIVVATSDQPALVRLRSAFLATAIAEYFRDAGRRVLFMMDSVTRVAMAQREIGLAIGEPPSSRGYTPSVFSLLPRLLERTGAGEHGFITAFYTVLVEADDMNEPVADAVRGILDGHIVLSRALATANHFPAIDVLESISRLTRDISTAEEVEIAGRARDLLALHRQNEDLINIGAYVPKSNPRIDAAIARYQPLCAFLRQPVEEKCGRADAYAALRRILA